MRKEALDRIGELIVKNVRNPSIRDIRDILLGRMKGDDAERIRAILVGIDDEDLARFAIVIPDLVDQVVHNLCVTLEEEQDLDLVLKTSSGDVKASEASDGLPGELYGDNGWLARFGPDS